MKTIATAVVILLLIGPLVRGADIAGAEAGLVKAELFTDAAELRPGQTFTAFVRLTIAEGWHVYWKNPGDSGQATRVSWVLPEGFAASELLYPVPGVFGDFQSTSFGYSGSVVLAARITPGPDAALLKDLSLGAEVSWLRCSKDVCVPGRASVQTPLPAPADQRKVAGDLARVWLPRMPADAAPADVAVSGSLADGGAAGGGDGGSGWGEFEIRVRGIRDVKGLKDFAFFPGAMAALEIEQTRIRQEDDRVIVSFRARVLKGLKLPATTLPCVLAYSDPTGERRGINVAVPLTPAK